MSATHKVVIVMGPIGSGKTQFVNEIAKTNFSTGESLEGGHTTKVQIADTSIGDQPVEVVDTPGLDADNDTKAKETIIQYLQKLSRQKSIVGFIYMYNISERRMTGSAKKTFESFTSICGTDALSRVSIVTNMWDLVNNEDGERRERELRDADYSYFKDAINQGARLVRNDVKGSGMEILRQMLDNQPVVLGGQAQHESGGFNGGGLSVPRKCCAGIKIKFWRK
ncbi:hypothetical protein WOLCODRAFT_149164 [Wolfiporia cocos MD-104 SS10]|uniref:AIG1-type G domain-containing protein n=1 Tax=Wolfiporia cocos (strain MD-104) TaxID=742152 RepID=A0A2H3J7H6_WOLCO|nr:hypothetical protein WOLCODRAFT_149164 [Wolfiporia cocos MD-104 SS10]